MDLVSCDVLHVGLLGQLVIRGSVFWCQYDTALNIAPEKYLRWVVGYDGVFEYPTMNAPHET